MKNRLKKLLLSVFLVFILMIMPIHPACAAEPDDGVRRYRGDLLVFLAYDGDIKEAGDHGMKYLGIDDPDNNPDIIAQTDIIRAGYTTTVSLEFPVAVSRIHMIAPVVVADGDVPLSSVEAKVSLTVDGMTLFTDFEANEVSSATPIGQYENSFLLPCGVGEDGNTFIDSAVLTGASKIEYTITISSVYEPVAVEPEETEEPVISDNPGAEMTDVMSPDAPTEPAPDGGVAEPAAGNGGVQVTNDDKIDGAGLAAGIIVAIIAVLMIIAGIIFSGKKKSEG